MITTVHLKIYEDSNGIQSIYESNLRRLNIYNDSLYFEKLNFILNRIKQINSGEIGSEYYTPFLYELADWCDSEVEKKFIERLYFFKHFQKAKMIVKKILSIVNKEHMFNTSSYRSYKEFRLFYKQLFHRLDRCEFAAIEKLNLEFLPTSNLQELASLNNWLHEYTTLSKILDAEYNFIVNPSKRYSYSMMSNFSNWFLSYKRLFMF